MIKLDFNKLSKYKKRLDAIKVNSHDLETQVAAIIIHPITGAVVAEGYNGFIRGADDDSLPKTRPEKYPYMIHAEANAIYNAVTSGVNTYGKTLFCTLSPCVNCLRMLWQTGIDTIYFVDKYRDFEKNIDMKDLEVNVEEITFKESTFYKATIKPRKKNNE